MPLRFAGWLLAGFAAWFAAAAATAWAPLWPALLAAAVLALPSPRGVMRFVLWWSADVVLVVGLGLISVPPLSPTRCAVAALILAAVGLGCDVVLERLPGVLRRTARWLAAPAVLGVLAFLVPALVPPVGERQPRDWAAFTSPYSGIMPEALPDERKVVLESPGSTAREATDPFLVLSSSTALTVAAPTSRPHSPRAARRWFPHARVDHAGYGDSPHPGPEAPVEAWDPLPTDLAAYQTLTAVPGVRGVAVVGHSMGNLDVVRLLNADAPLDAAVMMGAALPDPDADPEYWRGRFFTDRGITEATERFPVSEIRSLYDDIGRYVRRLAPAHASVHFVTFGIEWPNVAAMRGALYELLPGPKAMWHLPDTTHYLSAEDVDTVGVVIGDTRATRELAAGLRKLVPRVSGGAE